MRSNLYLKENQTVAHLGSSLFNNPLLEAERHPTSPCLPHHPPVHLPIHCLSSQKPSTHKPFRVMNAFLALQRTASHCRSDCILCDRSCTAGISLVARNLSSTQWPFVDSLLLQDIHRLSRISFAHDHLRSSRDTTKAAGFESMRVGVSTQPMGQEDCRKKHIGIEHE